jgi:3-deoxy-D-manno-octulosonate 8-phosphate phosphatase (KDO 8-P phosphatase)
MGQLIKAIFLDCDGVLTTGSYFYTADGKFMKEFSCMDGKGFTQAKEKGIYLLVITEEPDDAGFNITKKRCEDQKIEYARAKNPENKLVIAKDFASNKGFSLKESAFIADDIGDWFLLKEVGLPIAVANAHVKIKEFVLENEGYVTIRSGGHGAVREAIEWIFSKMDKDK